MQERLEQQSSARKRGWRWFVGIIAIPEEQIVTCIVVYEEQMRGWMAEISRMQTGTQLVVPYDSLATTLSIYCQVTVLPFDERAAAHFDEIKRLQDEIPSRRLALTTDHAQFLPDDWRRASGENFDGVQHLLVRNRSGVHLEG